MIITIVPSHNQSKHIEKIVRGYENQTVLPDLLLFVFDRCSDDSISIISSIKTKLNLKWVIKESGENFSAGMTRDFGVEYIKENFPEYEMIVFTDGDCVPSEKLIEKHLENIRKTNRSIVSCGMRYMETIDGVWKDDERMNEKWVNDYSFTNRNGRLILSREFCLNNLFTYSCNLAFNKNAIDLCSDINLKLNNVSRVFSPMFDGSWGGEDDFISHCLFRTGNWIVLTDKECFVNHYYHKESPKNIEKKNYLVQEQSRKLERTILNNIIEGPIQKCFQALRINFGNDIKNNIKNTYKIENLNQEILVYLDYIVEKYGKLEIPLKYMFTNNIKWISQESSLNSPDFYLSDFKQFSGYLKFYLNNDFIEFEDDIENFKLLDRKKACPTCNLDK